MWPIPPWRFFFGTLINFIFLVCCVLWLDYAENMTCFVFILKQLALSFYFFNLLLYISNRFKEFKYEIWSVCLFVVFLCHLVWSPYLLYICLVMVALCIIAREQTPILHVCNETSFLYTSLIFPILENE